MKASVSSIEQGTAVGRRAVELDRVVLQFGDHVARGFTDRAQWSRAAAGQADEVLETVEFQPLGAAEFEPLSLAGLKAAFFVKRFDGPGLDEMRFHDHVNPQANLWVRVVFLDGEVMEGLVVNGADFVLQPGFLLTPTDPDANHWLIYVAKGQLREFQVLGLRSALKS